MYVHHDGSDIDTGAGTKRQEKMDNAKQIEWQLFEQRILVISDRLCYGVLDGLFHWIWYLIHCVYIWCINWIIHIM